MVLLLIFLDVAATYSLTQLVTRDVFPPIKAFRKRIYRRFGSHHWLSYLVGCMRCASFYVGAVVVGSTWMLTDRGELPYPVLVWLLCTAVVGLMGLAPTDEDPEDSKD